MNPENAQPSDDEFDAWLAMYDEAIASGSPAPTDLAANISEQRPRYERAAAFVKILHRLWPLASNGDGGRTNVDAEPHSGLAAGDEPVRRYVLTRLHGVGGIGQVWLARDLELHREIALKELRPDRIGDSNLALRFLREAQITGRLQHPGIPPVYEMVGGPTDKSHENGGQPPFYTMRFVQGKTLSAAAHDYHERRQRGQATPLDLAGLLNAFVSVCQTVAYAHSRGVVHRDLKGQNVLLGDFGEVIVLDWGFAKLLAEKREALECGDASPPWIPLSHGIKGIEGGDASSHCKDPDGLSHGPPVDESNSSDLTMPGDVMGTPAYMAPEQTGEVSGPIDPRTDVYGLGAILYEILTGRPPYTGADAREILRKSREGPLVNPETVCPGVPRALAAVCRRALAKDPALRYLSAEKLAGEIQCWLADEPVEAYSEPMVERLRRWGRRHKPLVAAVAALFVMGTLAAVGTTLMAARLRTTAASERATADEKARQQLELQLYYQHLAAAERELSAFNLNGARNLLDACPSELRGWEWNCLQRLCYHDLATIASDHGEVYSVAFSPDGRQLATGGQDSKVRIWDARTGSLLHLLGSHNFFVKHVTYSPDGTLLLSTSQDGDIYVWNPKTGELLHTLEEPAQVVWSVAFSPDGSQFAVGAARTVSLWSTSTWRRMADVGNLKTTVFSVAYHPDGRTIAIGCGSGYVKIYNAAGTQELAALECHPSSVSRVAFSPDGRWLASGGGDYLRYSEGTVNVWDARTFKRICTLEGHSDPVESLAFRSDGQRLASGSRDGAVKLWDISSAREVLTLRAGGDRVYSLAFSRDPENLQLAAAGSQGGVQLWNANLEKPENPPGRGDKSQDLVGHTKRVFGLTYNWDGTRLASIGDDQTLFVWNTSNGDLLHRYPLDAKHIYSLAFNPAVNELGLTTNVGDIAILNPEDGSTVRRISGQRLALIETLSFSPNGRFIAAGYHNHAVQVWNTADGSMVHLLGGHVEPVVGVAWTKDGRFLASASHDRTAKIWEVETGKALHVLRGHMSRVTSASFSPDGTILATGGADRVVKLWDVSTGEPLETLHGHGGPVNSVCFDPMGKWIASASNDWTIKLWDAKTKVLARTLRGHTDRVQCIEFRRDGKQLASASYDHTLKLWDVP